MRAFRVLAFLGLLVPAAAGAQPVAARTAPLRAEGLTTFEAPVKAIDAGDFDHAGITRDSMAGTILLTQYRAVFATDCTSALPADRVEITERKCAYEQWRTYPNGMEVAGSRRCTRYEDVGTHRFADPEVNEVTDRALSTMLQRPGDLMAVLTNPLGAISSSQEMSTAATEDVRKLLKQNGCASGPTRRFQSNLVRFKANRQPIQSEGSDFPDAGEKVSSSLVPLWGPAASFNAMYCGRGCNGSSEPVVDMIKRLAPEGPPVLQCQYETQGGRKVRYFFWHSAPPPNIQALLAADPHGMLRYLGTRSTAKCPENEAKALQLRQSAMRETGFPPT